MTQRVLVTGAAGFIGSSLCERLIAEGHTVVGIDNFFRGSRSHLSTIETHPEFSFYEGDVTSLKEIQACAEVTKGFDLVHHLAAINGTKWFHETPRHVMETNIIGTLRTLEAAESWGARYVLASSPEAFGDTKTMPLLEEQSSMFPSAHSHQRFSYGASKYLDEVAVQHAVRCGVDARIVRPFNAYGPRMLGDAYGQVIGTMFQSVLDEVPILIHNGGGQTRCFSYIEDIVEGFFLAGELDEAVDDSVTLSGRCFNIGTSEEITMNDLAQHILAVSSKEGLGTVHTEGHPGDSSRRVPDCEAAMTGLGWSPKVGLKDGLRRMWDHLR